MEQNQTDFCDIHTESSDFSSKYLAWEIVCRHPIGISWWSILLAWHGLFTPLLTDPILTCAVMPPGPEWRIRYSGGRLCQSCLPSPGPPPFHPHPPKNLCVVVIPTFACTCADQYETSLCAPWDLVVGLVGWCKPSSSPVCSWICVKMLYSWLRPW